MNTTEIKVERTQDKIKSLHSKRLCFYRSPPEDETELDRLEEYAIARLQGRLDRLIPTLMMM